MTLRGQSRTITAISTAALIGAATYSFAQQAGGTGGLKLTFDVGAGAEVINNEDLKDPAEGNTFRSDATVGFSALSETRTERLSFGVSTDLRYKNEPGSSGDTELRPPVARFQYSRTGSDSRLEFSGTYRRERIDDTVLQFVDEDFNPVDLVFDNGELRRVTLGSTLNIGLEAPLGFDLGVNFDDRKYIDTFDPDLYDRTSIRVNGTARLRFSDVLTGRITASYRSFDADNPEDTDRDTTRVGAGATYALSQDTEVSAGVDYTRIETTEFGATDTTEGVGFDLGATRSFAGGSLSGTIARRINEASKRTEFGFDRAMELPRGELSYGFGYSIPDSGKNALLARLSYSKEMRDGSLSASLTQSTAADDDDEDVLLTRVSVGYAREINEISGLNLDFGLGRSEDIGGGPDDTTTRADVTVTYRREIVRDVDWSVGYRARFRDEDSGDTAMSNTFFTRINRSFSIRP